MQFKKGDRVQILDEQGTAVFVSYNHDGTATVEFQGFQCEVPVKKLVPAPDPASFPLPDISLKFYNDPPERRKCDFKRKRRAKQLVREIDLHAEKLQAHPEFKKGMHILQFQLKLCQRALDEAIVRGDKKLIIIHGVGEGKLREEIRKMLCSYDAVSWEDASYSQYGQGATEVTFH